jgi:hypothetical protein
MAITIHCGKIQQTMQWHLHYKMCDDEGDAKGKKKAKTALEDLLGIKK